MLAKLVKNTQKDDKVTDCLQRIISAEAIRKSLDKEKLQDEKDQDIDASFDDIPEAELFEYWEDMDRQQ